MAGAYRYGETLLARAGSFWRTSVDGSARLGIQSLLSTAGTGSHMEELYRLEAVLSSRPETGTGGFGLRFKASDVVDLSGYMAEAVNKGFLDASGLMVEFVERPAVSGAPYVVNTGAGYLVLFNADTGLVPGESAWALRIPADLRVQAVRTAAGELMHAGQDFTAGRGVLVFRDSPVDLFPENTLPVEAAFRQVHGTRNSLAASRRTVPGTGRYMLACMRGRRSAWNLVRGAAEYAGMFVVQRDGFVRAVETGPGNVRYVTDHGVFTVPYAHEPLPEGPVAAGTVAGGGARPLDQSRDRWWTPALDHGFGLDDLCPVQGLRVPGGLMRLELYTHPSGHLCTKPWLEGDRLEEYWELVAAAERREGATLGTAAGLAAAGDTTRVFGVDFFMENALGNHVLVFDLGGVDPLFTERMKLFIRENRPASKGVVFA